MERFQVSFRKFAILSGVRQEAGAYAICIHPRAANLQRKGILMLMTEPAGLHASFGLEACRLAQSAVIESYYGDGSLSLTSSLTNALEAANNALLQYNYDEPVAQEGQSSNVAVQGGGVQTKKARVGMNALLIRPDGAGVYIAQMAPAQLYILHNGMLSTVPVPAAWQGTQQSGIRAVGAEDNEQEDSEEMVGPGLSLQAAPLGTGPGVEADMLFRRIDPGDLVVAVSASLARHLDRPAAERIFSQSESDTIIEALHNMAMNLGLAEAHACVLEMGTDTVSGIETDFRTPLSAPAEGDVSTNGGVSVMPPGHTRASATDLRNILRSPGSWLSRRRNESAREQWQGPETVLHEGGIEAQEEPDQQARPTETLLSRSVNRPPYQTQNTQDTEETNSEVQDELEFDGGEDMPPALGSNIRPQIVMSPASSPIDESRKRVLIKPSSAVDGPASHGTGALQHSPFKVPTLFDLTEDVDENAVPLHLQSVSKSTAGKRRILDVTAVGKQAAQTLSVAVRNLLPDKQTSATPKSASTGIRVPMSFVIGTVGVVLITLLGLSILNMIGGNRSQATNTLLQQATQEDLLANQPSISVEQKRQHLFSALAKAKDAFTAAPGSTEAQLLMAKIQGEIDKAEGITRLSQVKLLFNLDQPSKQQSIPSPASSVNPGTTLPASNQVLTSTVSTKEAVTDLVVQANDAYVLDKDAGKIYRCKISTQTCSVALSKGDTAGGQKVGQITKLTSRVGNLVALDDARVSYVFDPDSSAWQGQALGDASKLEQPKDIASYDGHLYLLGSKAGQISKYVSGKYGDPPDDWIKDPASVAQLKDPQSIAIDGIIYVLLSDGKIVALQGGKIARTIEPKTSSAGAASDLFTSTDTRDLYMLRSGEGSITKISKEGQTLAVYKAPATSEQLAHISGMTVDEGRAKIYLFAGRQVYEAQLPGRTPAQTVPDAPTTEQKPAARPTAAP